MASASWNFELRKHAPLTVGLLALAGVAWWTGSLSLQLAFATLLLIVLIALVVQLYQELFAVPAQPAPLETLLQLAQDREISALHADLAEALKRISAKPDPIFRRLALQSLQNMVDQIHRLAADTIEFSSTESWRVVYEELLRSPGLHLYRSVAYIETAHYWQDGPGQQSTQLNLQLHDAGTVNIERIAIIADFLWAKSDRFPVEPIQTWLDQQYRHGIWLRLVRESQLAGESDLLSDFGIYGSRAVGMQLADAAGRTVRFELSFDFERVKRAEDIWKRLQVFSTSYRDLLDQRS